jgi:DNA-directed RNA polymerase specialized sigma24 family protein
MITNTQKLLADYAQNGSERAFGELLRRYIDLVYSAALRSMNGDAHRAQDITQTVFIDLARSARKLPQNVLLGRWLHRHTCFVASTLRRSEARRQVRERIASEMRAN